MIAKYYEFMTEYVYKESGQKEKLLAMSNRMIPIVERMFSSMPEGVKEQMSEELKGLLDELVEGGK